MDLVDPLSHLGWGYSAVFVFYLFFVAFGLINIVVGTFVEGMAQATREDKDVLIQQELSQFKHYAERIKMFFHDADTDHSGTLTWGEFEQHLQDERVKAYFQTLELDVSQAQALFM